jgi:hypothetical protein
MSAQKLIYCTCNSHKMVHCTYNFKRNCCVCAHLKFVIFGNELSLNSMWEFLPTSGNQNCIYYTNQHHRKSQSFTAAFKHTQNIAATAIGKVTLPTEVSICSTHYLVSSACCHQCYDTMYSGMWVTFHGEHNTLIPENDSSMSFPRTHHATWHHVPEECHVTHRIKICHNLPIHSFTENKTKKTDRP